MKNIAARRQREAIMYRSGALRDGFWRAACRVRQITPVLGSAKSKAQKNDAALRGAPTRGPADLRNGAMKRDVERCSLFGDKPDRAVGLIEEFAPQAMAWRRAQKANRLHGCWRQISAALWRLSLRILVFALDCHHCRRLYVSAECRRGIVHAFALLSGDEGRSIGPRPPAFKPEAAAGPLTIAGPFERRAILGPLTPRTISEPMFPLRSRD